MSIERVLDRALAGHSNDEPEVDSLVAVARDLLRSFAIEPETSSRERAMFVVGVAARRRGPGLTRFLVPALALLLVVLVGFASRVALPGDALYPVREALQRVGLATSPWAAVDEEIDRATRHVLAAEAALGARDLPSAEESANAAIARLDNALERLEGLDGGGKITRVLQITTLQDRAEEVIAAVERAEDKPDPSDRGPEPARRGDDDEDEEGDDDDGDDTGDATDGDHGAGDDGNSGPGGGDDGGGDGDNDGEDIGDGGNGGGDGETLDGNGGTADPEELDD